MIGGVDNSYRLACVLLCVTFIIASIEGLRVCVAVGYGGNGRWVLVFECNYKVDGVLVLCVLELGYNYKVHGVLGVEGTGLGWVLGAEFNYKVDGVLGVEGTGLGWVLGVECNYGVEWVLGVCVH